MKKHLVDVLGGIIGLVGYRIFFWGITYDPQVFFNSAILALNCYILFKMDKLPHKSDKWTSFIISIVIGVVASYVFLSR